MKNEILYSMCWEDPDIVLEALNVRENDTVLTVASGGESIFAILLKNPEKVIAIDNNLDQIYLVELKIAAIKSLDFEEFIRFLGFKKSFDRVKIFKKCERYLSENSCKYWKRNIKSVKSGIIHCGKFERYIGIFRNFFLPLVLSKRMMCYYLSMEGISEQRDFYEKHWNSLKWRLLFKLFFSKTVMQWAGRKRQFFKYNKMQNISEYYLNKAKFCIESIPIQSNYFVHYILSGSVPIPFNHHPYLNKIKFSELKKLVSKVHLVHADILKYLTTLQENSISKFNLSNVFELMTQEDYEKALNTILRVSETTARFCYWNNLVPRYSHPKIDNIVAEKNLAEKLFRRGRVPFYSRLIVESISD